MQDRNPVTPPETEEISVVRPTEALVESDTDCKKIAAKGAQVALAVIGLGAGALYLGPAQSCANIDKCGKWLSDLTNRKFAVGILTAGGLDFSGGAAYMAAESGEATVNYISKQKTTAAKIGMGTFVIVFGASQITPLLLASLRTSSAVWQTVLTVGGATPSSVFGAIHITEDLVPYYLSQIKRYASVTHRSVVDLCMPSTEIEKQQWARISHFRLQHAAFLETIDARWRYVVANAGTINVEGQKDPLSFLFSANVTPQAESWLGNSVHNIGTLAGLLLAANFSAGGVSNTFHLLKKFIPTTALQAVVTSLLSVSGVYANARLAVHGVNSMLETMLDVLRGQPIHSLLFQLRPKTTVLTTAASLAASTLSYAVIAILYINEFQPNPNDGNKLLNAGLYGAMTGINVYHFASLFHLYHLLFSRLTPNQKEQFLLQVEKEIERLNNMPEDKFMKMVAADPDKYSTLGITPYADNKADIEAPTAPTENTPLNNSAGQKQSWFGRFFSGRNAAAQEDKFEYKQFHYSALK